jgi:hypothetical protein
MDRPTAIAQLREQCHAIATAVTCMHPLAPGLADQPAQDEIMKALFGLTREVEVVKKQLLKLERRDDSTIL